MRRHTLALRAEWHLRKGEEGVGDRLRKKTEEDGAFFKQKNN